MSQDPYYSFLALVTQDAHAVAAAKKKAQLIQRKELLANSLQALESDRAAAHARAHQAKKKLDAQELEIKILKERQRVLKSKLDASSSPKEYFSLEVEIKTIAADIDAQEEVLFELFAQSESLEKSYGQVDFQAVTQRPQITHDLTTIDHQIKQVEQEFNEYLSSCQELKPAVNPEMFEIFVRMKESLENPVVPVDKSACSACGHTVNTQDLVSMRKHKLVTCQNCFRLLYLVTP